MNTIAMTAEEAEEFLHEITDASSTTVNSVEPFIGGIEIDFDVDQVSMDANELVSLEGEATEVFLCYGETTHHYAFMFDGVDDQERIVVIYGSHFCGQSSDDEHEASLYGPALIVDASGADAARAKARAAIDAMVVSEIMDKIKDASELLPNAGSDIGAKLARSGKLRKLLRAMAEAA